MTPLETDIFNALLKCSDIRISGACGHYQKPECVGGDGLAPEVIDELIELGIVSQITASSRWAQWEATYRDGAGWAYTHGAELCPGYNQGAPQVAPTRERSWTWVAAGGAFVLAGVVALFKWRGK